MATLKVMLWFYYSTMDTFNPLLWLYYGTIDTLNPLLWLLVGEGGAGGAVSPVSETSGGVEDLHQLSETETPRREAGTSNVSYSITTNRMNKGRHQDSPAKAAEGY